MSKQNWRERIWSVFALTCMLGVILLLWWAPDERVLGRGIKIVYIHVASIWVGLTGFAVVSLWGLGLLLFSRERWLPGGKLLLWMALGWYGLGVGTSAIAAQINWGAVFWAEPRFAMSVRFIIVALPIATLALWIKQPRWLGLVMLLAPLYLLWSLWQSPLVLHPKNPIQTATSSAIQLTFLGCYLLFLGLGIWLTRTLSRSPLFPPPTQTTSNFPQQGEAGSMGA